MMSGDDFDPTAVHRPGRERAGKALGPEAEGAGDGEMAGPQAVAAGHLRAFIERIERLEEEKQAVSDDVKEVYAELKATGFEPKTVRVIVRLRKMDQAARQEAEAILDLYKAALGME